MTLDPDFAPRPAKALFIVPTGNMVFAERYDGWQLRASFDAFRADLALLESFAHMPAAGPSRARADPLHGLVDFEVGRIGRMGLMSTTGGDYAVVGHAGCFSRAWAGSFSCPGPRLFEPSSRAC